MVSHYEVARAFLFGKKLRGTNMFSTGDIIYSYGTHWPIAVRIGDICYVNTSKTSVSTSKHTSYVKSALHMYKVVTLNEIKEIVRQKEMNAEQKLMVLERTKYPQDEEELKVALKQYCYARKISPQRTAHMIKTFMSDLKKTATLSQI